MYLPMISSSKGSRCLILGCSRTKNEAAELLPAIQRYDGPPFKVLRRYIDENPGATHVLDIFVLSAKYGLIDGQTPIANYDRHMTNKRAVEMYDKVMGKIQSDLLPQNYGEIFLSMGRTYLQAMSGLENLVNGQTQVIISDGTAGRKLTELRNWLWGKDISPAKPKESGIITPRTTPQTAILRGHTVTLTTAETVEQLQAGIVQGPDSAHQIRSWYVDINGEKISPKWAAQYLFGVPVNQFSADEARRVLRRLGLNCNKE